MGDLGARRVPSRALPSLQLPLVQSRAGGRGAAAAPNE